VYFGLRSVDLVKGNGFGCGYGSGEKRVGGSVDDLLFGYAYMVSVWYCDMV